LQRLEALKNLNFDDVIQALIAVSDERKRAWDVKMDHHTTKAK
jgi:hypothetical protein